MYTLYCSHTRTSQKFIRLEMYTYFITTLFDSYREWVRMQRLSTSLTVCNPHYMNVLRSSASISYPQVQQRTSTTTTTITRDEKQYREFSAYDDVNFCYFIVTIPAVVVSVHSTSLIFVLLLIYLLIFLFTVCSHVFFRNSINIVMP